MRIKLVIEDEDQSQELLAAQISITDGPSFFKEAELWAWCFVMAGGKVIMRFLWERWAENEMRNRRRNGYRDIKALTIFTRVQARFPRPRKGSLPRPPRTSFMVEYLVAYLSAFFSYRQVQGLIRLFLGHKIGRWKTWSGTQRIIERLKAERVSISALSHPAENLVIQADGTGIKIRVKAKERKEEKTTHLTHPITSGL